MRRRHGGVYYDNQTGSPTSDFYDASFTVLTSFEPACPPNQFSRNWTPVWYIQNC